MPTYFKREIADLNGTGKPQYRYDMRSEGVCDTAQLASRLGRDYRMLGGAELSGIVESLIDVMAKTLAEGYKVKLDGLGIFSIGLGEKDYDRDTAPSRRTGETNARRIEVRRVNFRPERAFIAEINNKCRRHLHRDEESTAPIRRPKTSPEERLAIALDHIRKNGYMRLTEYALLTHLSRAGACRELSRFCDDPAIPLRSEGHGSQKVFVEDNPSTTKDPIREFLDENGAFI